MAFDHLPPFHQMSTSEIARLFEQISESRDALRACVGELFAVVDADDDRLAFLVSGWPELAQALVVLRVAASWEGF